MCQISQNLLTRPSNKHVIKYRQKGHFKYKLYLVPFFLWLLKNPSSPAVILNKKKLICKIALHKMQHIIH